MLVGINFALELALLDVVLINFPLFFGAADKLAEAAGAALFFSKVELFLAWGELSLFLHVRFKDPEDPKNF